MRAPARDVVPAFSPHTAWQSLTSLSISLRDSMTLFNRISGKTREWISGESWAVWSARSCIVTAPPPSSLSVCSQASHA